MLGSLLSFQKCHLVQFGHFCLSIGTLTEKDFLRRELCTYLGVEATDPNHLPVRISLVT